jgi:hypothetical protein
LTNKSHAKSTTALNNNTQELNAPRQIINSGSSNDISKNVDSLDSSAPPLPPHRISSRAPIPQNNMHVPEAPRRNSSLRNSVENGGINVNNRYPSPNLNQNQPITRLVVDLEARYALLFHSISEFPAPKQFMNIEKSYPSRAVAVRPSNGI